MIRRTVHQTLPHELAKSRFGPGTRSCFGLNTVAENIIALVFAGETINPGDRQRPVGRVTSRGQRREMTRGSQLDSGGASQFP